MRLIQQKAGTKLQHGEIHTLENWVEAIPAEERAFHPDLQVLQGWIWNLLGKVPEALELEGVLAAPEIQQRITNQGWWYGLRCQLALVQENNLQALEIAKIALNEIDPAENFIRGILLTSLATAEQALGNTDEAITHYKQAMQVNRQAGNLLMTLLSLISLGVELVEQGQRLPRN